MGDMHWPINLSVRKCNKTWLYRHKTLLYNIMLAQHKTEASIYILYTWQH